MSTTPTIRNALSSDVSAMQACIQSSYQPYISRIGKPPGAMLDDYSEVVRRHQAYVAEVDGVVVGVLVLIPSKERVLLDNVALAPSFQGKGLGRRLIEFAEAKAREQGYRSLDLYTHERMTENIEMYMHLGYVETERRTERGYHRVYMRKILA